MLSRNLTMEGPYESIAMPEQTPQLFPVVADQHLPYLVPVVVFWVISLIFHYIDTHDFLSKYKLHTPAEDLKKNRASRYDVIKFAIIQQAAQCTLGYFMADRDDFVPQDQEVRLWAEWIQSATNLNSRTNHLNAWDLAVAKLVYWVVVPLCQYMAAMVLADTMQYFTHRAFHVNKWLYRHIHSMHHDIYVPFAYGAFYNHPLETIPIDGVLFPLCLSIARLNNRQAALFGAIWTFKTVVDHCGYDFPYNPCNIVCPNSVYYHDLHHQTWGMKFNFSVYASIWDKLMGTYWSPEDEKAQEKYTRSKINAEASLAKQGIQVSKGKSAAVEVHVREVTEEKSHLE